MISKAKKPSLRTRYLTNLFQAPLRPAKAVKEIAAKSGVGYRKASVTECELRRNALPVVKQIYWLEFPQLKTHVSVRIARSGLIEELTELIRKNPTGQLPTSKLIKQYEISYERIQTLAREIRNYFRFKGKIPRGGARIRYPPKVVETINQFALSHSQPIIIKDLIIEIAKRTRFVASASGLRRFLKRAGITVHGTGKGDLKTSLKILEEAGWKHGVGFEIPKRRISPTRR